MKVLTFESAPFDVRCHVAIEGDRAMIIDTTSGLDWGTFSPPLAAALRGLTVEAIYLTHLHVDHVGGAARMAKLTGAKTLMHEREAFVVEKGDARLTGAEMFGATMEPCPVTQVKTGDIVRLGSREFEVLLLPGHSPGHSALWDAESGTLFPGDVVFAQGSFGRVDLPGGDSAEMIRSLEALAALPVRRFFAGHLENVESGGREAIQQSLQNARAMLQ